MPRVYTKKPVHPCEGCSHWRPLYAGTGYNYKQKVARACHYILDTGHARSLICDVGEDCTVREEMTEELAAKYRMPWRTDMSE